jgi:hypothetical protein
MNTNAITDFADLALIELVSHARDGNVEPLARHIEKGGHLDAATRKFIAAHLRGEIKRKRGNRRTLAQEEIERKTVNLLRGLQFGIACLHGQRGSLRRAIDKYLEMHPQTNEETLKTYLKRQKGGVWSAMLEVADEVRASNGVSKSANSHPDC